jgi:hypothetical protein
MTGPTQHIARPPDPAEQAPAADTGQGPADGWVEVYVPPDDLTGTAKKLLDAAGEDPVEIEKVQTLSGGFRVPRGIADAAGVSPTDDNAVDPAATGTQAAFAPSAEPVSGDAVIAEEAERGTATAEAVGAVFDPPTEAVGGDAVIAADTERGAASPEAVGAVSTQNPTGDDPGDDPGDLLRGDDLDDALKAAGLSTAGRVADKRQRLAEHRAAH